MLGKYTIKVRLLDNVNPTCSNLEQFTLIIGNNHVSEKEIVNYLQTYKDKKNVLFFNDDYSEKNSVSSNIDDIDSSTMNEMDNEFDLPNSDLNLLYSGKNDLVSTYIHIVHIWRSIFFTKLRCLYRKK